MDNFFTHRDHDVEIEYCSLDDLLLIRIKREKATGIGDAQSVDELLEFVDDMIDTMTLPEEEWGKKDHEDDLLEESLDPEEVEEIREAIREAADEFDEMNRPYMEHRGYKADVIYIHEQKILEARVRDMPHLSVIQKRSLKSLWHHFVIQIDEYLENAAKML